MSTDLQQSPIQPPPLSIIRRAMNVTPAVEQAVEDYFSDALPSDDGRQRIARVRLAVKQLALHIIANVPDGTAKDRAIDDLKLMLHNCKDAIVTGGGY